MLEWLPLLRCPHLTSRGVALSTKESATLRLSFYHPIPLKIGICSAQNIPDIEYICEEERKETNNTLVERTSTFRLHQI